MADPSRRWTNAEKNYLLAEIIKAHNLPPSVLMSVIQQNKLHPLWGDTSLPLERPMNQCVAMFNELNQSQSSSRHPSTTGFSAPSPFMSQSIPPKRSHPSPEGAVPFGRELRPKPDPTPHTSIEQPSASEASPKDPPMKKKRGRPSKADVQARAEAKIAGSPSTAAPRLMAKPVPYTPSFGPLGDVNSPREATAPPILAPAPKSTTSPTAASSSLSTPLSPRAQQQVAPRLPISQPNRMSIGTMLTPTAGPATGPSSPSLSHKRRRRAESPQSQPALSPRGDILFSTRAQTFGEAAGSPQTPARGPQALYREETERTAQTAQTAQTIPHQRPPSTSAPSNQQLPAYSRP